MSYKVASPFNVALTLFVPSFSSSYGVATKSYSDAGRINGSFRSFGGTERDVNGVLSVEDTAVVETWYRPDIKSDCRIGVNGTDRIYEIMGEPEDIDLRHQFMKFKVRRVKGGA